jgi:hypothetical protein
MTDYDAAWRDATDDQTRAVVRDAEHSAREDGHIVYEHETETRTVDGVEVRIVRLTWSDGGLSYEVYRQDDDTDLTQDGCFDVLPTDEQIRILLDGEPHEPPTMTRYQTLTDGLPEFVNLAGLAETAAEYGIELDPIFRPVEEFPDEDKGPEFERASLAALIDALEAAGVDLRTADVGGSTVTHEDHWDDYCRQSAEEAGDVAHVAAHVDWPEYAASMRTDTTDVVVPQGQFAGTWYLHR